MKKIMFITVSLLLIITVTACTKEEKADESKESIMNQVHEHCTRTGIIDDNSSAEMEYELYYTGDIINRIESTEVVTSTSEETLNTYEEAYKKIHENYTDIDNYETKIIRTKNSVTSKMYIDYDKIDIKELVELEGEEDNIFEDNLPKVSKYKEFIKKVGITCKQVS